MREDSLSRFYELMVISVPEGTPEEILENTSSVSGYIESAGGQLLRSNTDSPWGRRRLAYPIRHKSQDVRDGIYALYHFEIDPANIPEIERDMKLNESLMRHLLLQLSDEPVFPEPDEEEDETAGEDGEAKAPVETATAEESAEESSDTDSEESAAADSSEETEETQETDEDDSPESSDSDEDEEESSESTPDDESESDEEE